MLRRSVLTAFCSMFCTWARVRSLRDQHIPTRLYPYLTRVLSFSVDAGVTIINFIRLSWERDELERQMYGEAADMALRPVWRMTEGFERAYTLQVQLHEPSRCLRMLSPAGDQQD